LAEVVWFDIRTAATCVLSGESLAHPNDKLPCGTLPPRTIRLSLLTLGLFLCMWTASAQVPGFEVASIKLSTDGRDGGSIRRRSDTFNATNVPLPHNAPEWASTDRFEIKGETAGGAPTAPVEQTKQMLQSLLQERFELKAHRETRDLPVYNLVLLKYGPKLSADQSPADPRQGFIQFASSGVPARLKSPGETDCKPPPEGSSRRSLAPRTGAPSASACTCRLTSRELSA